MITKNRVHKYQRLKDQLRKEIEEKNLLPDTRLPSQAELKKRERLSYATITRVFSDLAAEQLIYRVRGKGTFVASRQNVRPVTRVRPLIKIVLPFGVALNDANPLQAPIINGMLAEQHESQVDLEVVNPEESAIQSGRGLEELQLPSNAGVFFFSPSGYEPVIEALKARQMPYVVHAPWIGLSQALNCIVVDVRAGACMMTERLISAGHRRIVFLQRTPQSVWVQPKLEGYRQALQNRGMPMDEALVATTSIDEDEACQVALDFFRQSFADRPTAVMASDGLLALMTLRVARELGLRVPEDLAIVGYDDISKVATAQPALTTLLYPRFEIGREAVKLLAALIARPEIQPVAKVLPSKPVFRETFRES